MLSGKWRPEGNLPAVVAAALPDTSVRDHLLAVSEVDPGTAVWEVGRRFGCSGYVAESVPLAIYAAQRVLPGNFESVVRAAVEAGGDTDTIGSITGQIAGTYAGGSGLPEGLIKQLPDADGILEVASAFVSLTAACGER
jgi:ADP-ribosylglycohydrolase